MPKPFDQFSLELSPNARERLKHIQSTMAVRGPMQFVSSDTYTWSPQPNSTTIPSCAPHYNDRPMSDPQIEAIAKRKHFHDMTQLSDSDKVCLYWYIRGFKDAEEAHSIK